MACMPCNPPKWSNVMGWRVDADGNEYDLDTGELINDDKDT